MKHKHVRSNKLQFGYFTTEYYPISKNITLFYLKVKVGLNLVGIVIKNINESKFLIVKNILFKRSLYKYLIQHSVVFFNL